MNDKPSDGPSGPPGSSVVTEPATWVAIVGDQLANGIWLWGYAGVIAGLTTRPLARRLGRAATVRERPSPTWCPRQWCPRQESNLRTWLRRPMLYPLSYEGVVPSLPERFLPSGGDARDF